jgi:DNA-binding response OmpR family regulator
MAAERVLAVDDDPGVLRVYKAILEGGGYSVDQALSGKEALEAAGSRFYHLALLDIKLGDMDGTELLHKLQETSPTTVKVMVTGFASFDNAVRALNLKADAYLVKPVDPQTLLSTVQEQIRKRFQDETKSTGELFADLHRIRENQLRKSKPAGPQAGPSDPKK